MFFSFPDIEEESDKIPEEKLDKHILIVGFGLNGQNVAKAAKSAGIPYVKDVPGLGWLFGNRSKLSGMEDVLIFITPYILEEKPAQASTATGMPLSTGNPAQ